jgi:hypothetical protein
MNVVDENDGQSIAYMPDVYELFSNLESEITVIQIFPELANYLFLY